MKKVILLLSILFLSGCGNDVDGWKIHQATEKCENNAGIDYVNVHSFLKERVYCNDGTYYTINQHVDPSKVIHIGGK